MLYRLFPFSVLSAGKCFLHHVQGFESDIECGPAQDRELGGARADDTFLDKKDHGTVL